MSSGSEIPELISSLKSSYRSTQFEQVEKLLVRRQERQNQEVACLRKENEELKKEVSILKEKRGPERSVLARERRTEEIYADLLWKLLSENEKKENAGLLRTLISESEKKEDAVLVWKVLSENEMNDIVKLKTENEELKTENEELKKVDEEPKKENEKLKKEIEELKKENEDQKKKIETLEAFDGPWTTWKSKHEELERIISELEKDDAFKDDEHCDLQKDGEEADVVPSTRRVLDFDEVVFTSAVRSSKRQANGKVKAAGEALVVEITDSDDDSTMPSDFSEKVSGTGNGELSAEANGEKRSEVVKRDQKSLIDLTDGENVWKDSSTIRRKLRKIDGPSVGGDVHNSWSLPIHGAVLEKCKAANVKEKDFNSPIKSSVDGPVKSTNRGNSSGFNLGKRKHALGGRTDATISKWDLIADLSTNDELCMKAICALHKHRNSVRVSLERTKPPDINGLNLLRKASSLAEFLTEGDPQGSLKRSVAQLNYRSPYSISECRDTAWELLKQLFDINQEEEQPFFPELVGLLTS